MIIIYTKKVNEKEILNAWSNIFYLQENKTNDKNKDVKMNIIFKNNTLFSLRKKSYIMNSSQLQQYFIAGRLIRSSSLALFLSQLPTSQK